MNNTHRWLLRASLLLCAICISVLAARAESGANCTLRRDLGPFFTSLFMAGENVPRTETGALTGLVWNDLNENQVPEAGEPSLAGAVVTLRNQDGQLIGSQTTAEDGWYRLDNLPAGTYRLQATPPAGYIFISLNDLFIPISEQGTVTVNFAARLIATATPTPTRGTPSPTPTLTPTPSATPLLEPARARPASCSGSYQGDTRTARALVSRYSCKPSWNESGPEDLYVIQSAAVQPITLNLTYNAQQGDLDVFILDGPYADRCLAGGDTFAIIENAPAGDLYIVVDGYEGAAGAYNLDITCPLGPQATATPTSTPSATPSPFPTPTQTPTRTRTPTVTPTPTPRSYYLPSLLRVFPMPTSTPTRTPTATLTPTSTITVSPTPGVGLARIEGFVFEDLNENGRYEPWFGEPYISGVTITLSTEAGPIKSRVTVGGWYGFSNLQEGTYTVTETQPEGYISTTPDQITLHVWPGQRSIDNNFGERRITPP